MAKKKDFFDKYDYSTLEQTKPFCPHFGDCGGCSLQNIAYSSQLKLKEEYLKNLFKQDIIVLPSPIQNSYRNRMDFVYAYSTLGLRKRGDFRTVVDISTCHLIPEQFRELFNQVKELLKDIPSYDFLEHVGFLRYVTFRFAPTTGEVMIIFTSTTPSEDLESKLNDIISTLSKQVTSIYWLINDSLTDISVPQTSPYKIVGKETISEKLGDVTLQITPWSFFQANSVVSTIMFEEIKNNVSGSTVDLCCGVGAITLFVSDKASSLLGIEEVQQSIDLANLNAKENDKKALFVKASMKDLLEYVPFEVDTLIVDPPRAGLEKKVVKRILSAEPKKIIYMSCNPKTQKLDIDLLTKEGEYVLESIKAWDMFPQTPHVETLAVLSRKE